MRGRILVHLENKRITTPGAEQQGPSQTVQFLGITWQSGRQCIPSDILQQISELSSPSNKKELWQALGTSGFWQAHIAGFSIIAQPSYSLLKKHATWEWTVPHEETLRLLICNVLEYQAMSQIIPGASFSLHIGLTEKGYQWGLWQQAPNKAQLTPILFGSKGWQGSQSHYSPWEKSLLATYVALLDNEPITLDAPLEIQNPFPILKRIKESAPIPQGTAHSSTIQKMVMYIAYCE